MPGHNLFRILSAIHDHPWLIRDTDFALIHDIVYRHIDGEKTDLDALATKLGQPLENTRDVQMRGSVAVIDIQGPIFRHADIFTRISGASSVDGLAQDFREAVENPQVSQIVLNIESPGGQVSGIQDLADQIRQGSLLKPVTAYVDGLAASAAYWLASAANRIVASESSLIGSIGVVVSVTDNRSAQERQGVKRYEIVSTKSPLKRLDVATEEGRNQLLAIADALAEIFIGRVAAFRGTTTANVEENFGRGGMMIASDAMAAGMIDTVASFEDEMDRLTNPVTMRSLVPPIGKNPPPVPPAIKEHQVMNEPQIPASAPVPAALPASPPVAAVVPVDQKARIAAILTCQEANGREQLARTLALETDMDAETAKKILQASPLALPAEPAAPPLNPLQKAMKDVVNPKVGVSADANLGDENESEAAAVLRFVPANRKIA